MSFLVYLTLTKDKKPFKCKENHTNRKGKERILVVDLSR